MLIKKQVAICKVIFILSVLTGIPTSGLSQIDLTETGQVNLTIQTVFDSARSDLTIYQKYFGFHGVLRMAKGTALANRVTEQLRLALTSKFEEIAVPATAAGSRMRGK